MHDHASDLFRAARERREGAPPTAKPLRRITPRELEVLALIAEGHSSREIARMLWITEETVRTHVRRLLDRLGARTRAHAVSIAYLDGLWAKRNPDQAAG
jgi:DNA-binding CsgD family transcriptional regulator